MRIADMTFRQRLLAVLFVVAAGFGAVAWVSAQTLSEVRIGGARYAGLENDKDLTNEVSPPALFLGPAMFYVLEAAITTSADTRTIALKHADEAIADYRTKMTHWEAVTVDRGLGLKPKLFVEARQAGDRFLDGVIANVLPPIRATPVDSARAFAEFEKLLPDFRRHRAAIEEARAILARRMSTQEQQALEVSDSGQQLQLWISIGSAVLAVTLAFWLLRPVLLALIAARDKLRVMAEQDADLGARLAVTSQDEVGQLSHWLNQFLEKISILVRTVKKSTIQLRSTATQMAATSHEQEATVSAFGASTTEIAAATKEISATGAELTSTMGELDRVAKESASLAAGGRDSLTEMRGTMGTLATSSGLISQRLSTINEKARDITGVVTTITKVADQTNLLSVNAAIEAEKAGEYGRGFLVVAREIRRLADQTAAATLDIEQTVQQMQGAVSAGVMEMDKFAEQVRRSVGEVAAVSSRLDKIIGQVQVLTDQFAHVSEGMRAQAEGAGQINEAMGSLSGNVKETARSLGEFAVAAEEMKNSVEALKQEIGKFKLED